MINWHRLYYFYLGAERGGANSQGPGGFKVLPGVPGEKVNNVRSLTNTKTFCM